MTPTLYLYRSASYSWEAMAGSLWIIPTADERVVVEVKL